jgi:hypothetical protein
LTNPKKDGIINKMRKLSLRILCYVVISVVLILGACIKPVGMDDFLNDGKVQNIIGGAKEGVKGDITYTHPRDLKPTLSNGGTLAEDTVVTVRVSPPPNSITITASPPAGITYSNIEWYCNTVLLTTGNNLTITAGNAPFNEGNVYQLMVIGTTDGIPYSTWIFISVEP